MAETKGVYRNQNYSLSSALFDANLSNELGNSEKKRTHVIMEYEVSGTDFRKRKYNLIAINLC